MIEQGQLDFARRLNEKRSARPLSSMTLQTQIQKKVDSLSAAEKRLAQYILNDNTAAVLTTTGDLARAVGISESTVVRFAQSLGFRRFLTLARRLRRVPEMKRAVQKDLRTHLRAASRMEETIANIDKHGANPDEDVIIKLLPDAIFSF